MLLWHDFTFFCSTTATAKPRVAMSACLNGEAVRYDGSSKALETTSTLLAKHLTLLPICPEVGAGQPVPRPPVQLVQSNRGLEAIGREDNRLNVTAALDHYRKDCLQQIQAQLCGYIFKSRSPSCGIGTTPIFNTQGQQISTGNGLHADYFQQQLPWLVFADETELQSHQQCQRFIMSCLLGFDLQQATQQAGLMAVHRHYRFISDSLDGKAQGLLQEYLKADAAGNYWALLLKALAQTGTFNKH